MILTCLHRPSLLALPGVMAAVAMLCGGAPALSLPAAAVRAEAVGRLAVAPDGESTAELVRLTSALPARFLEVGLGRGLRVDGWPTAPGERHNVEFSRFDVYAAEARVLKVEGDRLAEVPRSRLAFFVGTITESPGDRVMLSVDPDTGVLFALTSRTERTFELRRQPESGAQTYLLASSASLEPTGDDAPTWACGEESSPLDSVFAAAEAPNALVGPAISALHTATVAVDTDNELMHLKFNNNTTTATNYLASLFALMNVMYERDLQVRLLQGDTFLRPSPASNPTNYSGDPYTRSCLQTINGQTICSANGLQLDEFSAYWAGGCGGTCGGVQRALTMLLSGKQTSNNSASGIAWLNSLCSSTMGYSFTHVFKFSGSTAAHDSRIVGHEVGHNFGSSHTHCYSPPIDTCYAGQGGCYSGTPSCPAPATYNGVSNVRGTVMSYCHLVGGCGASEVFHPATVNLLAPLISNRVGQCIFPASFFADGFEGGSLPGPWAAKSP